jgi:hypothetical protein
MTSTSNHADHVEPDLRRSGRPRSLPITWTAVATLLGLAIVAAGCRGSNPSGIAGSGSNNSLQTSASTISPNGLSYARCMRNHGVANFPDPSTSPGGGVAFQINAGLGSDLNSNSPTFRAADQACRSLLPGGEQAPRPSAQKIATEVRWAACMRSHGIPSFPDPDSQGAFDSSRFDDFSTAFQTASKACKALQPTGSMSAVPGHGS